jgi:hypothetical protein
MSSFLPFLRLLAFLLLHPLLRVLVLLADAALLPNADDHRYRRRRIPFRRGRHLSMAVGIAAGGT